jgi:hypothetical protein
VPQTVGELRRQPNEASAAVAPLDAGDDRLTSRSRNRLVRRDQRQRQLEHDGDPLALQTPALGTGGGHATVKVAAKSIDALVEMRELALEARQLMLNVSAARVRADTSDTAPHVANRLLENRATRAKLSESPPSGCLGRRQVRELLVESAESNEPVQVSPLVSRRRRITSARLAGCPPRLHRPHWPNSKNRARDGGGATRSDSSYLHGAWRRSACGSRTRTLRLLDPSCRCRTNDGEACAALRTRECESRTCRGVRALRSRRDNDKSLTQRPLAVAVRLPSRPDNPTTTRTDRRPFPSLAYHLQRFARVSSSPGVVSRAVILVEDAFAPWSEALARDLVASGFKVARLPDLSMVPFLVRDVTAVFIGARPAKHMELGVLARCRVAVPSLKVIVVAPVPASVDVEATLETCQGLVMIWPATRQDVLHALGQGDAARLGI